MIDHDDMVCEICGCALCVDECVEGDKTGRYICFDCILNEEDEYNYNCKNEVGLEEFLERDDFDDDEEVN